MAVDFTLTQGLLAAWQCPSMVGWWRQGRKWWWQGEMHSHFASFRWTSWLQIKQDRSCVHTLAVQTLGEVFWIARASSHCNVTALRKLGPGKKPDWISRIGESGVLLVAPARGHWFANVPSDPRLWDELQLQEGLEERMAFFSWQLQSFEHCYCIGMQGFIWKWNCIFACECSS